MFDHSGVRKQGGPLGLTRREFLLAGAGAGVFVLGLGGLGPGGEAEATPLDGLDVFTQGYPRAFFFRQTEGDARAGELSYEEWESRYLALDGIVGKVLSEENYHTGKNNLPFFRQFKAQNPRKMVLLHYNGTGRRVTDEATTRFFPGHFLHYKGTKLTRPISSLSQTVIHVADTSVFKTKRYSIGLADDIAIARVGSNGRPVWGTAEQVRLVRIDARNKTITVRRGMYGTNKNTFPNGSYLAAHVTTGPYGPGDVPEQNIPLWAYNFSTLCPRDAQGRNCGEVLADYLGDKLGPGGELSTFDGMVFDVFSWVIRFGNPIQDIDVNTDGRADQGIVGGVNTVGVGVNQFIRALRERLPEKLIMADAHEPRESQRGFEYLNGAEAEGFPDKYDILLDHLSKGENIFGYWKEHSPTPSFNFMNFRYKDYRPGRWRNTFLEPNLTEDRSYRKLRLALAYSVFNDSAFTCGGRIEHLPPEVAWREPPAGVAPGNVRVFDELWKGTEQLPHWLGQPLGPPIHRAALADDILGGQASGEGHSWLGSFIGRFRGEGVAFSRAGTASAPIMEVRTTVPARPPAMSFVLPSIQVSGQDLFVSVRLRADPLEGFSVSVPRRVDVGVSPQGGRVAAQDKEFTWAGRDPFSASLYFQAVGPGPVELHFEVEGEGKVYLERLTAHSAADGRHREFEGGIVFANPSPRTYTFNVGTIFEDLLSSGVTLRRLQRTANQDPHDRVNDGSVVGDQLTLPAKDALFVVRSGP